MAAAEPGALLKEKLRHSSAQVGLAQHRLRQFHPQQLIEALAHPMNHHRYAVRAQNELTRNRIIASGIRVVRQKLFQQIEMRRLLGGFELLLQAPNALLHENQSPALIERL